MAKKERKPRAFGFIQKRERLNRLQEILLAKDISQQWLANETKIGYPSINMYFNGKKEPSLETLKKIAEALGVKGGDLLNF